MCRGIKLPAMRHALWQDLRDAVRALRQSRRYVAWVVGSLAIGMAVTIAALAVLNASMVLPFPAVTEPLAAPSTSSPTRGR